MDSQNSKRWWAGSWFKPIKTAARKILGRQHDPIDYTFTRNDPAYARWQIGEWTYGKPRVLSWGKGGSMLRIGKFCSMAEGVTFALDADHHTDWVTTYPFIGLFSGAGHLVGHPTSRGDINVGNDVWLATDALVMSGVTIGDGAVIAARAVVTKDVPAYAIVAGVPAKVVRQRFDDVTTASLRRIRWWDWPEDKIRSAWPLLRSANLQEFIEHYGNPSTCAKS